MSQHPRQDNNTDPLQCGGPPNIPHGPAGNISNELLINRQDQEVQNMQYKPRVQSGPVVHVNPWSTSTQGVRVDFPASKLKSGSGSGSGSGFVVDRLAEEAQTRRDFAFRKPSYPSENTEEMSVVEDDAELTLSRVEADLIDESDDDGEENVMDLEALKEAEPSSKPDEILESSVDAAEWYLEVERVLPQLKVTIRTDNKDWRSHVDQMHQHRDGMESLLKETTTHLDKLQEDIGKTLEKASSREKCINNRLEHLIQDYCSAQAKLSEVKECYQQASRAVMEKTRVQAEISEELEKVKKEIEAKGSSLSDEAPLVKAKQSLKKLKQEIVQMDVRTGVVEHALLQAKLREKRHARHQH